MADHHPDWLLVPRDARIILDTSTLRSSALGDPGSLDIDELVGCLDERKVSISQVTSTEIIDDIVFGSLFSEKLTTSRWHRFMSKLDSLIDRSLPIVPNGRGLNDLLVSSDEEHEWMQRDRGLWRTLVTARNRTDFPRGTAAHVQSTKRNVTERWANALSNSSLSIDGSPTRFPLKEDVLVALREGFSELERFPDLELAVHAFAERFILAQLDSNAYRPSTNDAFDYEHLFMIALPAVLCTSDARFVRFCRGVRHKTLRRELAWRVMTPVDLIKYCRAHKDHVSRCFRQF